MTFILAGATLVQREIIRFLRQRSRIAGALATPLVFWILIGSGINQSFQFYPTSTGGSLPQLSYLQYFFPGTVVLITLFTAIFSTISIIEDRHEGFMQGILVAPVSRGAIVIGKLVGGTILAIMQAALFLLITPFLSITLNFPLLLMALLILTLTAFGLTGLGFLIAWRLDSTQGFHAVMNLFLMPLWFLSGALFPIHTAPNWLQWIMRLNPLSYAVSALQRAFYFGTDGMAPLPSLGFCFIVAAGFALIMYVAASAIAKRN